MTTGYAGRFHPMIDYIFPEPESKFITVDATVILKLTRPLNDQITNLPEFISIKSGNENVAGTTFLAADDRTIIFKPESRLPHNAKIDVTIQTRQFSDTDFSYSFYTPAEGPNAMDWLPKAAAPAENKMSARTPVRLINGVAVPSDFPIITTNQSGETAPGRIFFASTTIQGGFGNYIVICENDGTPYFYRRYDDIPRTGNLTVHANGELSFHCYETFYIVLDRNFVEVDTIYAGHGYYADDHELQILENGHVLQVARQHVKVDMSAVVESGNPNATVEAHHMQELDRDRNVIFEWNNWANLDIRDTYINLLGGFIDFVHMNSIAIDYDGHYILSPREYKEILKINRDTGETIWKLGGRDSDFEFINDELSFSFQHDARPVPGKPNHYTLFDNGRNRQPQFSRGVEYKLDLDKKTAEKVWEYRHTPDWYSGNMGSLQRLENGNTLIDFPGGPGMRMNEVNATGDVVWDMVVTGAYNYRARRFDWDGEMLKPYLILEHMGDTIRLIFNKFGDEHVNYYNVYAGTNANALALFDSTKQTYMDINAFDLTDGTTYFFRVTAVDHQNVESDFSDLHSATIQLVDSGENAVHGGDFSNPSAWDFKVLGDADATGAVNADGFFEININNGGTEIRQVNLQQTNILLLQGKDYVFEFDAYASTPRAIGAKVESIHSGRINYGKIDNTALSSRLKHFKYEFTMRHPTDTQARLIFECGGNDVDVFIDNVSLIYHDITDELLPLAEPWHSRDIGAPALSGLAGMAGDTLLVRGSGNDMSSQNDAFHFVYQYVEGDADIVAQVQSLEEIDPWAKAGVMMRNSLTASSRHVMMVLSANNGAAFQRRVEDGGGSTHTAGSSSRAPHWLRLRRSGDLFQGYESTNGSDWILVGLERISMNDTIYVGLPVTSHNNEVLCEALFSVVDLNGIRLDAETGKTAMPDFQLHPAFPNPFNPETTITYDLPTETHVSLVVYDVQGRRVRTLVDKSIKAGSHNIIWDGTNEGGEKVASGLYFYRIETGECSEVRKMTLLK